MQLKMNADSYWGWISPTHMKPTDDELIDEFIDEFIDDFFFIYWRIYWRVF